MGFSGFDATVFCGDRDQMEIRLLGPPMIRYKGRTFTHQQQALLTYLAVCGPASGQAIADALWGGRAMSASRFPNLLAEVRAVVGRELLPPSDNGYYRLANFVSDLAQLDALASTPDRPPSATTARLVAMQSLLGGVRGVPLYRSARPGRAYWHWLEDCYVQRACAERQLASLALELSTRLASNDPSQSIWAVEQGLRAMPGDQALTGRLVELYSQSGQTRSARTVANNWIRVHGEVDDYSAVGAIPEWAG